MKRTRLAVLVFAVIGIGMLAVPVFLADLPIARAMGSSGDDDDKKTAVNPDWRDGSKAVDAGDWQKAITHLARVVEAEPKNADAENLLGYSYRKLGDYDAALSHYTRALDVNPKHKGAHAYIGEAYLELGDLVQAEAHLKALDRICTFGCAEYRALKKAVKAYKKSASS